MPNPTPIRLLGAAALLSVSALAAAQQTPAPDPSPPAEKPPMARPESAPQTAPIPTPNNPATPPGASQAKPAHPLIGLTVISADGSKVGDVRAVRAAMDGKVTALRVNSGGFLGFGGRVVEIPEGRFTQIGDVVRLSLTAEDVSKLPAVKDAS
jgi:sporulation protein YlmC with PRC-barrel domain